MSTAKSTRRIFDEERVKEVVALLIRANRTWIGSSDGSMCVALFLLAAHRLRLI